MQPRSIVERMQVLEEEVAALGELPARVNALEAQLGGFREEVRVELAAIRGQLRTAQEKLREEIRESEGRLRGEISAGYQELVQPIWHTTRDT